MVSFIKRVFTFGGDKPADLPAEKPVEDRSPAADVAAVEALPVEPVAPSEVETVGGPSGDEVKADEASAVLAGPEETSGLGVVPLSLLEAEAAAEVRDTPPGLPAIPPTGGGTDTRPVLRQANEIPEEAGSPDDISVRADEPQAEITQSDAVLSGQNSATSLPPPVGGMAGRPGGDATSAEVSLPKGFSTSKAEPEIVAVVPPAKLTWFQRLRAGLARTSSQLTGQIAALFTKRKLDDETLEDLEDLLIQADLGVETAMRITGTLSSERYGKDVTGEDVSRIMSAEITKVLAPVAKPLELDLNHKPHVILVVGVNGTGKTTTIGKLAAKLSGSGLKVMLAAGDTFRAAAIEQLKIWADRTHSEFIGTKLGADAAGLAYDAYVQAKEKKSDVLIIDTAGRLQNKAELMAELEKIVRVLGKLDPDAPHTVLQTLDATTGQNAMNQVEIFRNVAGVGGLIMTKLDGTARGGILVAIAAKHRLPVYFIGVGEGIDDLEPFEAKDFAEAIAGLSPAPH
ncbi:signal recognition particle-docking protein FtsY [Neorhizobium sp. NCHU2750]|uniref:signal recognition particle-docking protein FtsY n=1 Tax=Neorhizobium sp. NCHU2750 TaxID=1825976 RepID=UPI000E733732|nr:fused signal recognition particle receptor [Neorhizobium sp. NCHU2750]